MSRPNDYAIEAESILYESGSTRVCRGRRLADDASVILKIFVGDASTHGYVECQREFEFIRRLDFEGAIEAHDLRPHEDSCMLVLEDFGGRSVAHHLKAGAEISLEDALVLGGQIARQLGEIHARGIIHRDINPANVVWNRQTGVLKVIDFDAAISRGPYDSGFVHPNEMHGTFAYMSPEQTGRMNRPLDHRSDLYGLGVSLYQFLVGQVPFETSDALELVHAHLAKVPVPPRARDQAIPEVVSELVMKLLAKSPEHRYQSAVGVARDLEQCLAQLRASGRVERFPLAEYDIVDALYFSGHLYGRSAEVGVLMEAFDRVSTGAREFMVVTGPSGIGKTALIQELHRPITARRGFFLSGKYDLVQNPTPYSAIARAFGGLLRQLLTEDERSLQSWREAIRDALGPNGQLIIDAIPDVKRIIGPQPAVAAVDGMDANVRFASAFQAFVQVFCAAEHPLVLFLDDLQWADAASLTLLETMMSDSGTSHFQLVVAYRDNEVDAAHAVVQTLGAIERAGERGHRLQVGPLAHDDVVSICAEVLCRSREAVDELAGLVRDKTGGSPFFVIHFLRRLHDSGLLGLDRDTNTWTWDLPRIRSANITDNLVDLLGAQIEQLPEATRRALGCAAFLGNRFDLPTLALVLDDTEAAAFAALSPAIEASIVAPVSAPVRSDDRSLSAPLVVHQLCFVHDRLQQAAHQLVPRAARASTHLAIGRLLRDHRSGARRDVFATVGHLNWARAELTDPQERHGLAELNLEAGERALAAQAIDVAADYLTLAMEGYGDPLWRSHPRFAYRVVLQRARAEFRRGEVKTAQSLLEELLTRVEDRFEQADIYALLIQVAAHQADLERGAEYAATALALFGIELSATPEAIGEQVEQIQQALAGKEVAALWQMPAAEDPETDATLRLLEVFIHIAVLTKQELMMVTGLQMARLVLQRGAHGRGAFGVAMFGAFTFNALADRPGGAALGEVAIRMADRFNMSSQLAQTCLFHGTALAGWVDHVRHCASIFDRGVQAGLAGGTPANVAYLLYNRSMLWFFEGKPLLAWVEDQVTSFAYIQKRGYTVTGAGAEGLEMIARTLLGRTEGALVFELGEEAEPAVIARWLEGHNKFGLAVYLLFKAFVQLLFGATDEARASLSRAEELLPFLVGHVITNLHPFLTGVARARQLPAMPQEERDEARATITAHLDTVRSHAQTCPDNFRHLESLLAAELSRAEGDWATAMTHYDEAVEHARAQGFVHFEAMGHEGLMTLWHERGKPEYALPNAMRARAAYERWGAVTKVDELTERYPRLFEAAPVVSRVGGSVGASGSTKTVSSHKGSTLDLSSVLKASQTLSGELVLDRLLSVLLHVVFECAGAERGALLLLRGGLLTVEAEGSAGASDDFLVQQGQPFGDWTGGAHSIVNYVRNTGEHVVVGNAADDERYAGDEYFADHRARSVLCMPLLARGEMAGVLYLENPVPDVFTHDRVELLDLIAGQMIISLDNARLYAELDVALAEARESERLKDEFLATTSHELRTPLNSIINLPRLMLAEIEQITVWACGECGARFRPSPEEVLGPQTACPSCGANELAPRREWVSDLELDEIVSHLQAVLESGQRLHALVDDVLNLSLLASGRDTLAIEPLDVGVLLDDVEALVSTAAEARGIELSFAMGEVADGSPPKLFADRRKVTQLLNNLVDNAIKFSDRGGRVVVVATIDDDEWVLSVSDEGEGVPVEDQASIFESFRQARQGATRGHGGAGLGLTIAKKLSELHGGSVQLHSDPGTGSSFVVRLPVKGPARSAP